MTETTLPPADDPRPEDPNRTQQLTGDPYPTQPLDPPSAAGAPPFGGDLPPAQTARPHGPRGWVVVLASALVAALVSAGVTAAMMRGDDAQPTVTPAGESGEVANESSAVPPAAAGTIAAVSTAVSPSVVHVAVAGLAGNGSGSGVVLREDGYILTNNHVVEGSEEVQITLPDGSSHAAEVVGTDEASDLAVVRAETDDLPVPQFADTPPRVGDTAVAIGSPFGLEGSVTTGVVSALNRSLPGDSGAALINMIQTDAAINPGNSGGALADGTGEVIGINTAILSPSGANDGIGFAIPITSALPIADQLIEQGFAEHAQLGIQGQDLDPEAAELYNLSAERGAIVVVVGEGTAAEDAGLERGDIITELDGAPTASMTDLAGQISAHQPNDEVVLTVVRGEETLTLNVTLGSAPRQ